MSAQTKAQALEEVATERRLNMIEAINEALDVMLARDPDVIVMGEDVGYFGGVFRCTAGLQEKHGKTRSEEHTSELQTLMRISYAVFCLKQNTTLSLDT